MLLKKYDAFISYAIEDKPTVASEIARRLRQSGIHIFYAGNELVVGDSISEKIYKGLRASKYTVMIFSPYSVREWPTVELHRFLEAEQRSRRLFILPVWHNISYEEVRRKYPLLSDRYAVSTSEGMEQVSSKLYRTIKTWKKRDARLLLRKAVVFVCAFVLFIAGVYFPFSRQAAAVFPSQKEIRTAVQQRLDNYQRRLDNDLQKTIALQNRKQTLLDSIIHTYNNFIQLSKYERNDYKFGNDQETISGRQNIEQLGFSTDIAPYLGYGIESPRAYFTQSGLPFQKDAAFSYSFTLINPAPLFFTIDTFLLEGKLVHVRVSYRQNIRAVEGSYTYVLDVKPIKKQQVHLMGYKPVEEYVFELKDGAWQILEIK